MEQQTKLEEIQIGEREAEKLKPANVKIVKAFVDTVGEKGNKKVICECQHPDKKDGTIQISGVKILKGEKVVSSGLWFNTDETKEERAEGKVGKLMKDSALAIFLRSQEAATVKELENKEVETLLDNSGFLVFKGY